MIFEMIPHAVPQLFGRTFKKKGAVLVSIASWSKADTVIRLKIDWKKLGIDPWHATISAPEIRNFQPGRVFGLNDSIPVSSGKGWLLVIRSKEK